MKDSDKVAPSHSWHDPMMPDRLAFQESRYSSPARFVKVKDKSDASGRDRKHLVWWQSLAFKL